MLKALELSGFKSFADKTRFDFPAGITVVVGPNGSGKSNIVDALKWVLGEQSAKSLRGKDMSDVIFKGSSGANSRKPANAASATIILDNVDGRLLNDAPEIHVTRRVYRSGESEYLINNEPCRLKDIRNLFRGTGVGTDAYSLIEQGKVERLLQAGAKDRRAIFEEAAGISRFKAQKVEAERRLERVQTNLTRLADIVEEVGSRFRSIKNQASKAAKYKEYTQRLQELRTFVGAKDYRGLSSKIDTAQQELEQLQLSTGTFESQLKDLDSKHKIAESQVDSIGLEADAIQEKVSAVREQILQADSVLELNRQRRVDFTTRTEQVTNAAAAAKQKLNELTRIRTTAEQELEVANKNFESAINELGELEKQIESTTVQIHERTQHIESNSAEENQLSAVIKGLASRISEITIQNELHRQTEQKLAAQSTSLSEQYTSKQQIHAATKQEAAALKLQAEQQDSALATAQQALDDMKSQMGELQHQLSELKSHYSGVTQRAQVIEELEKRQEGISSGAQELLKTAKRGSHHLASQIAGMVADLIEVTVDHAALVDAALGDRAQYIVSKGKELANEIACGNLVVSGRVGILDLESIASSQAPTGIELSENENVIGPVASLIQTAEPYRPLLNRMLAGNWIVVDIKTAIELRNELSEQHRFITLAGEILEPDGTLLVGPKSMSHGIVSRRSELRALVGESERLRRQLSQLEQDLEAVRKEVKVGESQVQRLLKENQSLGRGLAEIQAREKSIGDELSKLNTQLAGVDRERSTYVSAIATAVQSLARLQLDFSSNEEQQQAIHQTVQSNRNEIQILQNTQQELRKRETVARVQLAKWEQQRYDLTNRLESYQSQEDESKELAGNAHRELSAIEKGIADANATIDEATTRLELLSTERETLGTLFHERQTQRLEHDKQRKQIAHELQQTRERQRSTEERLNKATLRLQQMEMEREQLAARLLEDYGISISEIENPTTNAEAANRDEIDREITDLRQKIGSMGAVNMQALAELEELESRYQSLDQQYRDLVEARDTLLKIIQRINNDSRRLFVETLEAIRLNFQKLFRQTFGGGQADILLEEGVDVLEAGVEITATPPGKPKFNNSLLSGGEKALTAVSLLMAIFQFRPSPFCVLDEVDAPFDEANIGRFIDVLKSFLGWTKFVIVTHSKKTMTAATTLYGITMQESGVSKRVSVRFEDVSEDGQISSAAVERSESNAGEPAA